MARFWIFFLHRREFSWLVILTLVGVGLYALLAIPKEATPEVVIPIGVVTTIYPGASANDIEKLVTAKLEDAIENVDNLEKLTSVSNDGVSSITAEFRASANIDKSIQELKDAVDTAKGKLPQDAEDPMVMEINFANQPIFVLSISSDVTPSEFTALGERLQEEFSDVKGVSDVTVAGTEPRQVQVIIAPEKLATYDLTVAAVTAALASTNVGFPVGVITAGGIEYGVRLDGTLTTADDVGNVFINNSQGTPVFVRDIATITETVGKTTSLARVSVDHQPSENALTLSIYKKSGVNVTTMSAAVNEKLAAMQADGGLLADSQVLTIFDQGSDTEEQLSELVRAGTETVILVMISLLLTIGWRESVVAGLSIPLSFVIAFIGLYLSGNTINFLSLFALILAVGILVDSGIVVTEAIHTRYRKNGSALKASEETIKEYAWPLIAGTMTTVAVFTPLFFLSGIVGQFISSIPFTIIFVLIASIIVALGMVPLFAIAFTSKNKNETSALEKKQEEYTHRAQSWYRVKLLNFLNNAKAQRVFLWSLFGCFILALALPISGVLKVVFFPAEDVDYLYVDMEMAQGTPLMETDLVMRSVEEVLYEQPDIASFSTDVGQASAFTGGTGSGGRFGNITIKLNPDRSMDSAHIAAELRQQLAAINQADIKITEQQNSPASGAPINIKLTGDSFSELSSSAELIAAKLATINGVRDIKNSADTSASEFVLHIDNTKASQYGVSPTTIAGTLRATVFGISATTINRDGKDIDVVVKLGEASELLTLNENTEISLDDLRNSIIVTPSGDTVLLGALLTSDYQTANTAITRQDKERVVTVGAYTTDQTTPTEAVNAFKKLEPELNLPTGVTLSYGGETEDINQSFTEMFLALVAGLLLMLGILVLTFNSIRYSLYLLLAVPYSLIGVFLGLTILGLELSFTSLLGVIALAGVIINHAIILLDSLIVSRANQNDHTPLVEQVANASVSRFRPILLTTITTVVGMIPLSRISDFWSPLAFSIMFGLSFAMILTLILIPTLFYRNEKRKLEKLKNI